MFLVQGSRSHLYFFGVKAISRNKIAFVSERLACFASQVLYLTPQSKAKAGRNFCWLGYPIIWCVRHDLFPGCFTLSCLSWFHSPRTMTCSSSGPAPSTSRLRSGSKLRSSVLGLSKLLKAAQNVRVNVHSIVVLESLLSTNLLDDIAQRLPHKGERVDSADRITLSECSLA